MGKPKKNTEYEYPEDLSLIDGCEERELHTNEQIVDFIIL